jgi:beta-galactosidase/beta-glucuronidase
VVFSNLSDWSQSKDDRIKYYSGMAAYTQTFVCKAVDKKNGLWLEIGKVANLADVYVNGIYCGTAWTVPYRVNISKALKNGKNKIEIDLSNTWANRLIGDHALPENKQITWTNAPYRLGNKPLLPAGLLGPVEIEELIY